MAAQASLCLTWLQTPKTGFLVMRLIYVSLNFYYSNAKAGWGAKEVQVPKAGQGDVLWAENAETGGLLKIGIHYWETISVVPIICVHVHKLACSCSEENRQGNSVTPKKYIFVFQVS